MRMKPSVVRKLDDSFVVQDNRCESLLGNLLQALTTSRKNEDPAEVTAMRTARPEVVFGRVATRILERYQKGLTSEQVMKELDLNAMKSRKNMDEIDKKVTQFIRQRKAKASENSKPWGRLL